MGSRILKHPFIVVFLFALVTHAALGALLFFRGFQVHEMTDGTQYMALADNLLAGRGFSERTQAPYVPDTIRTPLYPLFLAVSKAITGSFDPSLAVSILLGSTIPLAGMLLAILLGRKDRREILAVGLFLSLDPHLFYYSLIYGSEAVFLPLAAWALVAGSIALIRPNIRVGAVAGALFGLAVLARPIVQFFPFVIALFLVIVWRSNRDVRKTAWKTAAILLTAYALVVSPWIIRNERLFGVFDFTNVGWFNMYTRVAATTYAIHEHRDYDPVRIEFLQRLHDKGYIAKTPVLEQDIQGYEWKPIFKRETWAIITQYPREFVVSQVSSFFTVISQDQTALYLKKMGFIDFSYPSFAPFVKLSQEGVLATIVAVWHILSFPLLISIFGRFFWFILFGLSLWAVVAARKQGRGAFALALLLALYELYIVALSLNAAAQSDARYRAQFIFVEVPLVLIAVVGIIRAHRENTLRQAQDDTRCPVCSSRFEVRLWGMKRGYSICRCGLCGARFVHRLPAEDELRAFYSEQYFFGGGAHGGYVDYEADKRAARDSLESFVTLIDTHAGEKGKLLDVGAATGVFLEAAKQRGWDPFGNELSEAAVARAIEKGIPMTAGPLSVASYGSGMFDAVSLLDVIEHVPDPTETVRTVATLLRTNGIMLLNTPDSGSWYARLMGLKWHAYNPPEHLTIFNRRSLALLSERAGFDVVWSGKVKKSFRTSYILHTLSHWTRFRLFSRLASAIERRPSWNWAIPLNLRDNIVMVARKRV
jgi:SAM-dependent methyltransferase